ncbi:META domain-containing protein [Polymorphobacter fuscus]|uniref:META domain-containing protein n=1 Tax=Sandarakinorhabdus fusca TaxID=1439888 RepID=A0A7C9GQ13_9SPHN|nr:META domain-containing protein [Polymorphobacter fuscus]KAB7647879.1 META domain-containing protein [Polymorphobacter fuscus]MQT17190.1 META domain-containing protein [Polymorphobacter fuscus]NJC08816.1 heat shock protein HslJ [Polymorphobacter fuscus]
MTRRVVLITIGLLALSACAKEVALVKGDLPALGGSLEGGPWLVEDLNGGGVPDGVRVDATFEPGDQNTSVVYGAGGCNRYRGSWQQTGATVKFGPLAGTMMMCEPAKMDTERKFLQTMEAVRTVSFDSTGAALLKAPDGRTIRLRREAK